MCTGIENALCVHVKTMQLCWDLMIYYVMELRMHVCVHVKTM